METCIHPRSSLIDCDQWIKYSVKRSPGSIVTNPHLSFVVSENTPFDLVSNRLRVNTGNGEVSVAFEICELRNIHNQHQVVVFDIFDV